MTIIKKPSRFSTSQCIDALHADLKEKEYILRHSRHNVTAVGAAPNSTTSHKEAVSCEQDTRERVLRYDENGKKI